MLSKRKELQVPLEGKFSVVQILQEGKHRKTVNIIENNFFKFYRMSFTHIGLGVDLERYILNFYLTMIRWIELILTVGILMCRIL